MFTTCAVHVFQCSVCSVLQRLIAFQSKIHTKKMVYIHLNNFLKEFVLASTNEKNCKESDIISFFYFSI